MVVTVLGIIVLILQGGKHFHAVNRFIEALAATDRFGRIRLDNSANRERDRGEETVSAESVGNRWRRKKSHRNDECDDSGDNVPQ